MKVSTSIQLFILSSFLSFNTAVASEPTNATELEDAPECAIQCLAQLVKGPTLSDENKDILCHNKAISSGAAGCTLVQCSMRDLFGTAASPSLPELDNDHKIRGLVYSILGTVVISVFFRTLLKFQRSQSWGPDDVTIIAAAAFSVLSTLMTGLMTYKGLGRNVWLFDDHTITTFYIYLLVFQYGYVLSLCLVKLSILFFFLRTFPDQTFRTLVKWTIGFNVLTTVIFSICGALQRQPVYLLWEGWKEFPPKGISLNIPAIIFSHAAVNIALDVWMFVLPLTQLYHLGLKPKKKAGVMLIFGVGIFLTAASCIRIPYLIGFSRSLNSTADSQGFIVWSNIECGIGILVACMPHMQPVFRAIAERARSWKVLPTSSNVGDGMFVQRGLKTIPMTNAVGNDMRTDGTTLVGGDDVTLNDSGGLLTLKGSTISGKRNGGSVSDGRASESVGLGEGCQV
uniref:Rhodopsin domain-containing protein n=1 Tax=Gibberella zeae TaxID=5518 RepID=A0A4E9EBJ5_GIBZA